MNYRGGLLTGIGCTLLVVAAMGGTWWIVTAKQESLPKSTTPPPAEVVKTLKEDQINTIVLTEKAIARLDLKTAPITREKITRARTYGGEIVLPPGRAVIVSAPVSGTLRTAENVAARPGETVTAGQPMFELQPILTPEGRASLAAALVQAEGDANSAVAQRDALQIALTRSQRVFDREAGSRRALDDAQAQFNVAEQTLAAATKRQKTLEQLAGEAKQGTAGPLPIESPLAGMVRNVSAVPGQAVAAGAPLFEVIDPSRVWVRVGVYRGEADAVDAAAQARVGTLSSKLANDAATASPIAAPPSANALAGTIDLYYELENEDAKYRPGERVAVQLSLSGEAESLVAPWSAVIHDLYGGTWVYEQTAERTYARRRVTVERVVDKKAILASGPAVDTKVVSAGAAELFGTETGFTK